MTVSFENRYRAKDGSCRWLVWTSRSDAPDGRRHYHPVKFPFVDAIPERYRGETATAPATTGRALP